MFDYVWFVRLGLVKLGQFKLGIRLLKFGGFEYG